MERHLFLLLWFIIIILLLSSALLSLVIYLREKKKTIKYYSFTLFSIVLLSFDVLIMVYLEINVNAKLIPLWIKGTLFGGLYPALIIYFLSLFVHHFVGAKVDSFRKIMFLSISLIVLIKTIILLPLLNTFIPIKLINVTVFFLIYFMNTATVIQNYKTLLKPFKKYAIFLMFSMWYLFFISIISITYAPQVSGWYVLFYFFLLGLLSTIYSIKHLLTHHEHQGKKQLADTNQITSREREIVKYVLEGLSNKAIAKELHVTDHTVKKHLQNVYQKLNITSKLQLFSLFEKK